MERQIWLLSTIDTEQFPEESRILDLASSLHKRFNVESRAPYNLEATRLM